MEPKRSSSTNEIKKTLDIYSSKWKLITVFVIIALSISYVYLRYATYEYKATATIKIKDEQQSQKLPSLSEMTGAGLLSNGTKKSVKSLKRNLLVIP